MPSVASRPPTLSALSPRRTRSSSTACVDVAAGLRQRVLALHHARAGLVAELLDLLGGNLGLVAHFSSSFVSSCLRSRRRRAASALSRAGCASGSTLGWRGLGGRLGDRRLGRAGPRRPPGLGAAPRLGLGGAPRRRRRGLGGLLDRRSRRPSRARPWRAGLDLLGMARTGGSRRRARRGSVAACSAAAASAEPVPRGVSRRGLRRPRRPAASATSRGSPSPACVSAASASARLAASAAACSSASRRARSSARAAAARRPRRGRPPPRSGSARGPAGPRRRSPA